MRLVKTIEPLKNNPLPKGFTEVEYLEGNGTQYINTGLVSTAQSKVDIVFSFATMESGVSNNCAIFGGRNNTTSQTFTLFKLATGNPQYFRFDYNGQKQIGTASNLTWNTTSKYRFEYNGSRATTTNITTGQSAYENFSAGSSFTRAPICLFAVNYDNTSAGTGVIAEQFLSGRIYHYWYTDGTNTIDLIPALDPTEKPCMYDLIGGQVYYNLGSGSDFTYGRKIIPVEYLESSGTQYINTGYAFTDNFAWEVDFEGILDNTTLFGGRTSSARTALLYQRVEGSTFVTTCPIAGLNGAATPFQLSDLRTGRHTVKMAVNANKGSVWEDGVQLYNETSFTGTYISGTPQVIFADNFGTSVSEYTASKVYGLKMWQGSNLARDFIPCKDENNVGYMFDNVTHTCYLNAGSGSFIVGNILHTKKLRLIRDGKIHGKGYTEVEYLESSGSTTDFQWIDTGIKPTTTTKIRCVLSCAEMGTANNITFYGARTAADAITNLGLLNYQATQKIRFDRGAYAYSGSYGPLNANTFYEVVQDGNQNYVNGVSAPNSTGTFANVDYTIFIFGINDNGSYLTNLPSSPGVWKESVKRFKLFQIWDNGVLLRDMIPVLDSDGVPAMYDKVTSQFFYNQGTGQFTYGHKIIPVKYLEADGTQYIDTGIVPTNSTGVYAKMSYTDINNRVTFGSMVSGNGFVGPYFASTTTFTGWWTRWGTNEPRAAGSPTAGTIYEFFMNLYNDRISRVDNTIISSPLPNISGTFPNMTLFRRNFSSGYAYLLGRIYAAKMTDGSTLVRDYVPVKDENGVGYMFDKVTHSLFGNSGTGSFIVGDEIKNVVRFVNNDLDGYEIGDYIESTGTQYIDTGYVMTNGQSSTWEGKMTWTKSEGSANFFYGYRSVNTAEYRGDMRSFFIYGTNTSPSGRLAIRYGVNTDNSTSTSVTLNNPFKMSWDGLNLKVDDVTKVSLSTAYTPAVYRSMWLFWCNCTGYYSADVSHFTGRIYYWKIWDNDVLVRNLLPAKRKSDNAIGMLDVVNKVFYTNAGTGNFTFQPKG